MSPPPLDSPGTSPGFFSPMTEPRGTQHVIVDAAPSPQHVIVDRPPRKVKFDPTVNLGHVLTVISFIAVAVTGWTTLDKRVVVLEEARKVQMERDAQQDGYLKERLSELQKGQDAIARSIERLSDKLDARVGR